MKPISNQERENVILFPKSIDYYQIELTRMLETERYQEAIDLLQFLLHCETGDPRADEEWTALLGWLESLSISPAIEVEKDPEDAAETESDLFKMHVQSKNRSDAGYVQILLDTLANDAAPDKQMLAIEQLSYMEHPDITAALKGWLELSSHYPGLQFKALQALKHRGAEGTASILRPGGRIQVDIEETPLSFGEFPAPVQEILRRVTQACEVNDPGLGYFAEEMWSEFLAFVYGTGVYRILLSNVEKELDIWAAALHQVMAEAMTGSPEEREALDMYGITEGETASWRQACQVLRSFVSASERM